MLSLYEGMKVKEADSFMLELKRSMIPALSCHEREISMCDLLFLVFRCERVSLLSCMAHDRKKRSVEEQWLK
jgi:hypothetical protein